MNSNLKPLVKCFALALAAPHLVFAHQDLRYIHSRPVSIGFAPSAIKGSQDMTPAAVGGALAGYVAEKVVETAFKAYRSEKLADDVAGKYTTAPSNNYFDLTDSLKHRPSSQWTDQEVDLIIENLDGLDQVVVNFEPHQNSNQYVNPVQVEMIKRFTLMNLEQKRFAIRGEQNNIFLAGIAAGAAAGAAIGLAKEVIKASSGNDSKFAPAEKYFDLQTK